MMHVALLRGVNVGGNQLPMKDLREIFEDAGCREVSTFIQSGNVVFRPPPRGTAALPAIVSKSIAQRFGYSIPVIMRSAVEVARVVKSNPFSKLAKEERTLHVYFLGDFPSRAAVASLDPGRSAPDRFRVVGREVFLQLSNGMARTKLSNAYFDSKLATVSTARNWRTVQRIAAIANPNVET